jgi:HAE1 family hydrophobic/amphiphilic exporter-1
VELPLGTTATLGGVSADQADSFSQLGLALLAAVAIVFIVMVATFSSLIQPLILLISIPFAATGALGLLLITDTPLGVPSLIGMLLLVGIVVTNAIVLIDLINQYRKQGRGIQESIMDGARQRLRPILMTALATIFALTPMALGITGGGGFISQPLAVVVIGGLFSSTILTLVIVPVLYWLVEGRKERKEANRKSPKRPSKVKKTKTA